MHLDAGEHALSAADSMDTALLPLLNPEISRNDPGSSHTMSYSSMHVHQQAEV